VWGGGGVEWGKIQTMGMRRRSKCGLHCWLAGISTHTSGHMRCWILRKTAPVLLILQKICKLEFAKCPCNTSLTSW
jgi:hypothetical protein